MAKRGFGEVERGTNARTRKTTGYRARYWAPDLNRYQKTFSTKLDAEAWLSAEEALIARDAWTAPAQRDAARAAKAVTVAQYAMGYVDRREAAGRAPRTIDEYRRYVSRFIEGDLIGTTPVSEVTRADGGAWHQRVLQATGKTMAGRVYSFLSSVFNDASAAGCSASTRYR